MKLNPKFVAFIVAIGCAASYAAASTKSATGTDLTVLAAWDAVPTSADIATWATGSLGAGLTAASNVSWAGINISDAATNVGITGAGSLTLGASGVTLTGNKTLTVANSIVLGSSQIWSIADATASTAADATFSGAISGTGLGLTKSGAGTLVLTGASTFTGNVTINASGGTVNVGGTVNSGNPTATSLGNMTIVGKTVTVNSGASLVFTSSDGWGAYNYKTPVMLVADGGTITRSAGTTTFNSIGDVTLKNGGRLTTTNGNAPSVGSFGLNGNVTVTGTSGSFIDTLAGQTTNSYINLGTTAGSTTFDVAATGDAIADLTVSAVLGDKVLGGAANLIKTGAGKMAVSGVYSYTGATTVSNGILSPTSASATTLKSLSIANGATLSTDVASGTNQRNLTGNLTLTGGTLSANSNVSNTSKGQFYLSNASQQVLVTGDNTSTIAAEMHMAGTHIFNVADGASAVDLLVSGKLSHEHGAAWGGIQKTGAGTMSLTSSLDTGAPAVANGLAGFELGGGTLSFSGSLGYSGIAPASKAGYYLADFSANSTLKWNTGNTFDPTLNGNLRIRDAVTATFDTNGNTVAFGSAIINGTTGTGALTKTGAGTLTLSAVNTYSGATAVNVGSLLVNGSLAAGSAVSIGGSGTLGGSGTVNGTVAVASGGTLTGSGSVNGAVAVASGGKIAAGTGATTLTLAGGLTLGTAGGDTSIFNITPRTAGLTPSLNITLNNGFVANGGAGTSTINILGAAPALGTYTLINYLGTLGGNGFGSLTLGTLPSRVLASLVDNSGSTSIDLNVTGVDSARWSGGVGSEWSTANIGGSKNWVLNSNGVTSTDYISGDTVVFDDTATTPAVDIGVANVTPASVVFDHTSKDYTLTGAGKITGATGLTKNGGGTLTISNTGNDYIGTTAIDGGTLVISGAGKLGGTSAPLTIGGGKLDLGATSQTVDAVSITAAAASGNTIQNGTLAGTSYAASNASGTATVTANLAGGAATLAKSGAGTLSLTGINTFTGATSITAGTLEIGGAGQLNSGAYAGAISNAGALFVNTTANQTLSGAISGAGALTKANAGTLTLSGASTFTGNITVNSGTLNVGLTVNNANPTATALGDMTTIGKTVTVNSGSSLVFTQPDAIGQYNYKSPVMLVADGGTITRMNGSFNSIGDVTLRNGGRLTSANGQNATVNSLSLNGDVIVSGTSGSFIDTSGSSNNGIHLATGVVSSTISFDVASTGDATADLTVSAPLVDKTLGGAAGIIKNGAGKMLITGANSYSGGTTINGGILQLGNGSTTGSLSTTGAITNNANLNINRSNAVTQGTDFSAAAITGTGSLTAAGTGTMTLSAANSYSGGTSVNAGADLRINGAQTGAGSVTVAATGKLGGSGSVIGGINVSGVLAPGNSIESLGGGALSFTNGSTYAYELQTDLYAGTPGVAADLTYSSGTLSIASGTTLTLTDLATSVALVNGSKLTLISSVGAWNGGLFSYLGNTLADDSTFTLGVNEWRFDYDDTIGGSNYAGDQAGAANFVTMTVIPEPSSAILVGGLGMLGLLRRRRR